MIQLRLSGIHDFEFEQALAHHFALCIVATQAIRGLLVFSIQSPIHVIVDEASPALMDEYVVSTAVKILSTLPTFGATLLLGFQDAHALAKSDRFGQSGRNRAQTVNALLVVLGSY